MNPKLKGVIKAVGGGCGSFTICTAISAVLPPAGLIASAAYMIGKVAISTAIIAPLGESLAQRVEEVLGVAEKKGMSDE